MPLLSSSLARPRPVWRYWTHDWQVLCALFLLLAVTWLVYQNAMPGFFLFDDIENLATLERFPVTDWPSLINYLRASRSGSVGRPLAMLSFLVHDNAWPTDPGPVKQGNLYLHLICGLLVFVVLRLVFARCIDQRTADWLAVAAAALWMLHPLWLSTVMYSIQRMTQLSAIFVLAGVAVHLKLRSMSRPQTAGTFATLGLSLLLFTGLAVLSKETGVLLPVFILALEATVLANQPSGRAFSWWKRAFLVLPSAVLVLYVWDPSRWMSGYEIRDFTLTERLLTQPVVLAKYLYHLFTLQVSGLGLYQDDFPIVRGLSDVRAMFGLAMLAAAAAGALIMRKRVPVISLGILWFLVGHVLESSPINLELYFEHRNYLPSIGPLAAAVFGCYQILAHSVPRYAHMLAGLTPVVLVVISALVTAGYAKSWRDPIELQGIWAAEHPGSARAQRAFAAALAGRGYAHNSLDVLDAAHERFPDDPSFPVLSMNVACFYDLPLRFDPSDLVSASAAYRLTPGTASVVRDFFKRLPQTGCARRSGDFQALIPALAGTDGSVSSPGSVASLFTSSGQLYLREGNGDAAAMAFFAAELATPTPDTALRIAQLFYGAGRYSDAYSAFVVAYQRERQEMRWYFPIVEQAYLDHLDQLDRLIRSLAQDTIVPVENDPGDEANSIGSD